MDIERRRWYDALVQYELEKEEKRDRYYREDKGLEKDYYPLCCAPLYNHIAPIVIRPELFRGGIKTTEDESSLTPMEQRLVQTKRKIQL